MAHAARMAGSDTGAALKRKYDSISKKISDRYAKIKRLFAEGHGAEDSAITVVQEEIETLVAERDALEVKHTKKKARVSAVQRQRPPLHHYEARGTTASVGPPAGEQNALGNALHDATGEIARLHAALLSATAEVMRLRAAEQSHADDLAVAEEDIAGAHRLLASAEAARDMAEERAAEAEIRAAAARTMAEERAADAEMRAAAARTMAEERAAEAEMRAAAAETSAEEAQIKLMHVEANIEAMAELRSKHKEKGMAFANKHLNTLVRRAEAKAEAEAQARLKIEKDLQNAYTEIKLARSGGRTAVLYNNAATQCDTAAVYKVPVQVTPLHRHGGVNTSPVGWDENAYSSRLSNYSQGTQFSSSKSCSR
ncbi:hypothetical protein JKP88DRAFT_243932 [Tribonema minus]|uniref:Uncharacterized protein n=1 Tax=Tribonema minus TaxID=303371 RepID=A0A835Z5M0_9STRA|nr:hypothetical protein JKP88DRAFT_243932 [Tribonema minus]